MQLVKLEQTINNRKRFNRSNIYCYPTELLSPSWKKEKKIHYKKNSLYFGKWNFMALILKNFLYFLYISGNGNMEKSTLKKFLLFRETKLSNSKLAKLLIFQERTSKPQKLKVFILLFLYYFTNTLFSCFDYNKVFFLIL